MSDRDEDWISAGRAAKRLGADVQVAGPGSTDLIAARASSRSAWDTVVPEARARARFTDVIAPEHAGTLLEKTPKPAARPAPYQPGQEELRVLHTTDGTHTVSTLRQGARPRRN
jgi:hypothetical protein